MGRVDSILQRAWYHDLGLCSTSQLLFLVGQFWLVVGTPGDPPSDPGVGQHVLFGWVHLY